MIVRQTLIWLINTAILCSACHGVPLQGKWLDRAFSNYLSARCGQNVILKDVKIVHGHDVFFRTLKVHSPQGEPLMNATAGHAYLKNIRLVKNPGFEALVDFEKVEFSRNAYKNSPTHRFWAHWLKKPIVVKNLKLHIWQKNHSTRLEILNAASKDIRLNGGMTLDKNMHAVQNKIHATFSISMFFRALVLR